MGMPEDQRSRSFAFSPQHAKTGVLGTRPSWKKAPMTWAFRCSAQDGGPGGVGSVMACELDPTSSNTRHSGITWDAVGYPGRGWGGSPSSPKSRDIAEIGWRGAKLCWSGVL